MVTVPPFLCTNCCSFSPFLCAHCPCVLLYLLFYYIHCSYCSSVPNVPLCLLFLRSSVPVVLLFLRTYCSSVPLYPLSLCFCAGTIPLFVRTYCLCELMVNYFACNYDNITTEERNIIIHAKNSTLIHKHIHWQKKGNTTFDVTMGSYDSAETCELVGTYTLAKERQHNIRRNNGKLRRRRNM